jgi:hypothetical protein
LHGSFAVIIIKYWPFILIFAAAFKVLCSCKVVQLDFVLAMLHFEFTIVPQVILHSHEIKIDKKTNGFR